MTNRKIRTLQELHNEMHILQADYTQRGIQLKLDAKTYIQQFSIGNLIHKFITPTRLLKLDEKTNISGKIMSVILPLLMNSTIFRGSGFITKALATLVSRKVGKSLDAESLSGIFSTVKSLFTGKKEKKEKVAFVDYGIPPDSETY